MNYRKMDSLANGIIDKSARLIKSAAWFPLKTGKLRDMAVYVAPKPKLMGSSASAIFFDASIAPYLDFLEDGTGPHDIPRAFGYPLPFGIGGRFSGKFHPGSVKHKGFIANKSVDLTYQVALSECSKIGRVESW
jgi:hypothetical protein